MSLLRLATLLLLTAAAAAAAAEAQAQERVIRKLNQERDKSGNRAYRMRTVHSFYSSSAFFFYVEVVCLPAAIVAAETLELPARRRGSGVQRRTQVLYYTVLFQACLCVQSQSSWTMSWILLCVQLGLTLGGPGSDTLAERWD